MTFSLPVKELPQGACVPSRHREPVFIRGGLRCPLREGPFRSLQKGCSSEDGKDPVQFRTLGAARDSGPDGHEESFPLEPRFVADLPDHLPIGGFAFVGGDLQGLAKGRQDLPRFFFPQEKPGFRIDFVAVVEEEIHIIADIGKGDQIVADGYGDFLDPT